MNQNTNELRRFQTGNKELRVVKYADGTIELLVINHKAGADVNKNITLNFGNGAEATGQALVQFNTIKQVLGMEF